ncbi:hypothetical protein M2390_000891 [Mycetocola sp. BIGb0189]|uniref:DUF2004 domain-containing protein n=1 Tax=Mycetocola sp. BIGb0189 TaxID=2940604 RepID=UPI002168856C|nr:DUF2004 domain-containing protein [Mycetocola sp. BIGb0189]MCS4275730.1 hypothetical protein [Mycetocola sp. BIGb0189]
MALEHDFFGLLSTGGPGGIYWSETVEFGDQAVGVSLSAEDAQNVTEESLEVAAAMISSLEELDLRAREAMIAEISSRHTAVSKFIALLEDEHGEDLEDYFSHISGDRDIDLLRAIAVIGVRFSPSHAGEDNTFVVFEYALSMDESDDVLLVSLNNRGEAVSIEQD